MSRMCQGILGAALAMTAAGCTINSPLLAPATPIICGPCGAQAHNDSPPLTPSAGPLPAIPAIAIPRLDGPTRSPRVLIGRSSKLCVLPD